MVQPGQPGDERRIADAEIQQWMAEVDYDVATDRGRALVKVLCQAITGELVMAIRFGQLHERARRLKVHLPRPLPAAWQDDPAYFVYEAAAAGAVRFVAEKLRLWDPNGTTSLLTFATNHVLMNALASSYRKHHKAEQRRAGERPSELLDLQPSTTRLDSGDVEQELLTRVLDCLAEQCWLPPGMSTERFVQIVKLRLDGMSRTEIGRRLEIDPKTVGRRLTEYRQHLVDRHGWVPRGGEDR